MGTKMVTTEKSFSDIDLQLKVRLVMHRQLYLPIPRECGGGEKEEKEEEEASHGTNPPEELGVVAGGGEGAFGLATSFLLITPTLSFAHRKGSAHRARTFQTVKEKPLRSL